MRKLLVLALAAGFCGGCASLPKTVTYQTTEWREITEQQPAITITTHQGQGTEATQSNKTVVVQADIPQVFPGARKGRKYLNIGYNPVNPNRAIAGEEIEFILPVDTYVKTLDRDNKQSTGWMLAGERVIGIPTSNPDLYKAIWIRRCGNPILNEDQIAIFIRVRRDSVAQPVAVPAAPTQSIVQLPPIKRWVPETVTRTRELTCRERKSGWGSVIGGTLGVGAGIFTHNKLIALAGGAVGTLIGSWFDGGCIEPVEAAQAIGFGALGYGLTKERVRHHDPPAAGPAPLPPNGPAIPPSSGGGPAVLPSNGPAYFNGGAPIAPSGPGFLPIN